MDMHLRGKVAVISGASIGIGLAVANALAEGAQSSWPPARPIAARRGGERRQGHWRRLPVACDVATVEGAAAVDCCNREGSSAARTS